MHKTVFKSKNTAENQLKYSKAFQFTKVSTQGLHGGGGGGAGV